MESYACRDDSLILQKRGLHMHFCIIKKKKLDHFVRNTKYQQGEEKWTTFFKWP